MLSTLVTAVAVIDAIVAIAPASAAPDGTLTVEVLKYPTPIFGVRLAELDKGAAPNDMDILGPPENERDMDGGQVSEIFRITPHGRPSTASAIYAVEQDGRSLGTFRINFELGARGDPNNLAVTCDEQLSPIACYAFENPFVVRIYDKDAITNS